MKKILVTGSTTGIGLRTAQMLHDAGHRVVLHARDEDRATAVAADFPGSPHVLVGDLASLDETVLLGRAARDLGPFDAVIHNAGIYESAGRRTVTNDGLERTFQVNVLAPYVLTALIPVPRRLVYVTSGMASGGEMVLTDLQRERRRWSATGAYQDSKLCDLAMTLAMARRYPWCAVNAVCPGWVRTRMGGHGAPTDVDTGSGTQVWLSGSDDPPALRSGRYMRHMRELQAPDAAMDQSTQDGLLAACRDLSGVEPTVR